jgi:DNA phosphorothioation-associated putative methyltransferase
MTMIGKRVVDDLYVHLSAVDHLQDEVHRRRIREAAEALCAMPGASPNVAKICLRTGRLSLLAYPDFDDAAFPELAASWIFAPGSVTPTSYRVYADSLNPPILHRKELLVPPGHPGRDEWAELTLVAEQLGLFDDTTTIGFRVNWERLAASKGYQMVDGEFLPIGNEMAGDAGASPQGSGVVHRHLTALTRNNLSAPIQLLLRHGLLAPDKTLFDYGCGKGDDIAGLTSAGIVAGGWDPHFAADQPIYDADVVNLGFVVNVIEDPAERVEAVQRAFKLARGVMSVAVMLHASDQTGRPFADGYITSRSTFQKYFSQGEFKDYIEQVLHHEAFLAGPGVAFVFRDKNLEQQFNAGRFRSRGVAARLLASRPVRPRLPKLPREGTRVRSGPARANAVLEEARPLLDLLWEKALDLGRMPELDEVANLSEINSRVGGLGKAIRLLMGHYPMPMLAAAASTRSDDLRLFLAAQRFSRRPAYRQLEPRLQKDIKTFFGDYNSAQSAGLALLRDAAVPSKVFEACQVAATAGLGWLEDQRSLQLHVSMVERLPAVLRAYVACGLILWDAMSDVQLVKIHIASGKLTLMEFDDFDSSPTPLLRRRIKVNIRRQDCELFEYGTREYPKPLLFNKSRFLDEDYPGFAEQLAFDEALDATGVLGGSDFGPSPDRLGALLEARRLAICGMRLVRSRRIPSLDQPCGKNFTFRSFIECGDTQRRLGVKNVPTNPDTYNALYDLASQILDPLIDYFGGIRLTYGFCSAELGKHITRRVAPKLDQHASCEVSARGTAICDRGGASCDFLVEDEDMREVADWIIANLPFDRMYFYGSTRPIHVSYAPNPSRQTFHMVEGASGRLLPRRYSGRSTPEPTSGT